MEEATIVQTLKTEPECQGFFYDGRFHDNPPEPASHQENVYYSKYSTGCPMSGCVFLDVVLKGETLESYTKDDVLIETRKVIQAHKKANFTAKVNTSGACIYDLVPTRVIEKFFSRKEQLYKQVIKTSIIPDDYEILHKAHVLSSRIEERKIKTRLDTTDRVSYDIYSSATGRFATKKGSFPILNLKKELRQELRPKNDLFVELDYNGAEVRTLLAMSGRPQPDVDIHDWNNRFCLESENLSREEAKRSFFAWLYNAGKKDLNFEKIYDKTIYKQFYSDGSILTPFGRNLPVDDSKALNYLLQSTTADIVTEKAFNILNILKGNKTEICFTIHDSVVLDVDRREFELVKSIRKEFETTRLGIFKSNIKLGKNFGEMKEILI